MTFVRNEFFNANESGTDYFIGDIHGRFDLLMSTLRQMRFRFEKDRLFVAGDLIDRREQNKEVVDLLDEPWFFSSFGNHEQLFLDAIDNPKSKEYLANHIHNGGAWAWDFDNLEEGFPIPTEEAKEVADKIRARCPLMMTVNTPRGKIGVIHANGPNQWPEEGEEVTFNDDMIWNRGIHRGVLSMGEYAPQHLIKGVDAVVHGHTSYPDMKQNANRIWIDTASYGEFTILCADEALDLAFKKMDEIKRREVTEKNPWMT